MKLLLRGSESDVERNSRLDFGESNGAVWSSIMSLAGAGVKANLILIFAKGCARKLSYFLHFQITRTPGRCV
jgi:hypothetical protein